MNTDSPLVCDMSVFTPAERDAHILKTTQLIQAVQQVREVGQGYELVFANETELILKIAEFMANERLCCPFLQFTLNIFSTGEAISLALTGPIGTQEFLRAEFGRAML